MTDLFARSFSGLFFLVFSAVALWWLRREYKQHGKLTRFGSIVHVAMYAVHGMFAGRLALGADAAQQPGHMAWIGMLAYIALAYAVTLIEEEHLTRVYGDSYMEYCQRVPRYIGLPKSEPGLS